MIPFWSQPIPWLADEVLQPIKTASYNYGGVIWIANNAALYPKNESSK
jgi:hypothetical protein